MTDQASSEKRIPTDDELRARLTPLQYEVTQRAGTERAFSGIYHDFKDDGMYHCVVCDEALFHSDTKYDSGSGWPSFYEAIDDDKVVLKEDRSHGMVRVEVVCATCGAQTILYANPAPDCVGTVQATKATVLRLCHGPLPKRGIMSRE